MSLDDRVSMDEITWRVALLCIYNRWASRSEEYHWQAHHFAYHFGDIVQGTVCHGLASWSCSALWIVSRICSRKLHDYESTRFGEWNKVDSIGDDCIVVWWHVDVTSSMSGMYCFAMGWAKDGDGRSRTKRGSRANIKWNGVKPVESVLCCLQCPGWFD